MHYALQEESLNVIGTTLIGLQADVLNITAFKPAIFSFSLQEWSYNNVTITYAYN